MTSETEQNAPSLAGMEKYRQPETRLKIRPNTFIKFDGSEHLVLQHMGSDNGVRIKYDIMLILYDLVSWKQVGELIAPWPEADQEKILDHLVMMGSSQMLLDGGDEEALKESENELPSTLGSRIHINVENHHNMLRDYVRMAAYRRAIERQVKPGAVAVDIGCGSGILSFFAVQAGASKVYAIERRPDIILLAEELANVNGFGDKIEFIQGTSSHIRETRLTPKPDILISEILGNGILEENVLEFTLDARDRFLKPGGKLLPAGLDIYVFAYDSGIQQDKPLEVAEFKDLYGIDFSLLGEVLCNKTITRTERYSPYANKTMSESLCVKTLDFMTLDKNAIVFESDLSMPILQDGQVSGFCAYFKAHLDEDTVLTNSPWAPSTHWTQLTFTLPSPRYVKKGDTLAVKMIYDGALRLQAAD